MKTSETKHVLSYIPGYNDSEKNKLYKLILEDEVYNNTFYENTILIISLIESDGLGYDSDDRESIVDRISFLIRTNKWFIRAILSFIIDEELARLSNGYLIVTDMGKVFINLDKRIAHGILIRYFWEKADWCNIFGVGTNSKFTNKEGRKYIAFLFYKMKESNDWVKCFQLDLCLNYSIFFKGYYNLVEMIKDPNMGYVINYILIPLGLLKYEGSNCNSLITTGLGIKIFNHYSFNILDEYKKLIDESWENYYRGNYHQAYEIAADIVSVNWDYVDAYNLIGCIHIKLKEFEKAKNIFAFCKRILEEEYGNIKPSCYSELETYILVHYNLGICFFYIGEMFNALKMFTMLKSLAPHLIPNLDTAIEIIKGYIISK